MPPDLNHVALFARVVEAGSFSGAARTLGMPKATVSRNVARLEDALGTRLLHRTTRKVELTAMGRTYYEEVAQGLSSLESAREHIAATRTEPSGTLRLTAPIGFGARRLLPWMGTFLAEHEKVRIELKLTDDPVDPIAAHVDAAFRTGPLESSSLFIRRIGSTRLVLLASPDYLARRGRPQRIEDLKRHDCVAFGPSLDDEVWRLKGPEGWHEVAVTGRIAVDGSHAEVQAAVAGLGIALLPMALADEHIAAGRLEQVLPDYGVDGGALHVVFPSNRHMPVALRALIDHVAERAALE